MAASNSTYSFSFEKLKNLHRSAQGVATLTLPERPLGSEIDPNRYLNGAISMLSDSIVSLYGNHHYLDDRFDKIEIQFGKTDRQVRNHFDYLNQRLDKDVNQRFDKLEWRFDKLEQRFDKLEWRFDKLEQRFDKLEWRFDKLEQRFDKFEQRFDKFECDVNQRFDEAKAINFNRFAKSLYAPIRKVAAPVQDGNGRTRYEVAPAFPKTIKRFWLLQRDTKSLISLAKHYSIEGWEDWQNLDQEDSDATQYLRLEDAVVAHPEQCLRALAAQWGLEHEQLERADKGAEETHPTAQKRKANDETEPRRVKARMASDCETEISILSSESQELIIRRKTTNSEPGVKVHRHITLDEVIRQYHMPGRSRLSVESAELGWETTSSGRKASHRVRAAMGGGPPAPDEKRRVPRVGQVVDEKPEDPKGKD